MPEVSVIIPNYNHGKFLKQRIDSVLNQTFNDFEVIILDDKSADNSRDIIDSYRKNFKISHIVFNKINSGSPFKQWKRGIELANGNFIWIAESDDYCNINFLEKLTATLKNNESTVLAYSQSYDVNENDDIIGNRLDWTNYFEENIWKDSFCIKGKKFLQYLYNRNVIPNVSACLIRKSCIRGVLDSDKFDENLKICGDWLAWLLIADIESAYFGFVNEHLNYFRYSKGSTRNHNSNKKLRQRLLEEAIIFNSGKFQIPKTILLEKNGMIKKRWLDLYSYRTLFFSFFRICSVMKISKYSLLNSYIKNH